ncbi:hypothetical protein BELL_0894g00010 [Botrytis elliptica]|uniref:Uncharacterized protein n=1 Tax=Botrytis elliptica TaxID=278938 RepID=A0A4Z1J153_9HELO|nr:hypothetical protein BELL_0894g00010 [Botrytis elliptica]
MHTQITRFGIPEIELGDSTETFPFLFPDTSELFGAKPAKSRRKLGLEIVLHIGLIFLYSITSLTVIVWFHVPRSSLTEETHHALPDLAVNYHSHQYPLMHESPFVGPPSPSVDSAWHSLLSNMSIRVSETELSSHSLTSVDLPNGGHLAWMGVFHELHCVKILQQANYREHYHPNVQGQELRNLQVHVGHCVEMLRATVMCRPDLATLTTFIWREGLKGPLLAPERPFRQCVDWNVLMGSIRNRVVGEEELGRLKNPLA